MGERDHEPRRIKPVSAEVDRSEPTERLTRFVEELMTQGYKKLQSPPHLQGRDFFVTCRTVVNPAHPERKVSVAEFGSGDDPSSWAKHFTEAVVLDVFEAIPPGSEQLVPVGHTDVDLAAISSGEDESVMVKARRDMSVRQGYRQKAREGLIEPYQTATSVADNIWRLNATDVVDSVESNPGQFIMTGAMRELLQQYNVPLTTSWRNLGLGSLLTGLQLEVLQQKHAQVLELPSSSAGVKSILHTMTRSNPAARIENDKINLSAVRRSDYVALVEPFLPEV